MLRVAMLTGLFAFGASVAARAADLDAALPFDDGEGHTAHRGLAAPPIPVKPRVVVNSPLSVGGPYLFVPGLNGPAGPPAYPLLPFAFGYGY